MAMFERKWILLVSLGLVACGDEGRPESTSNPYASASATVTVGGSATDPSGGGSTDGEASSADSEVGDTDPKLDVGFDTNASADDGGDKSGCKKVDFLFVIDNSGSMGDNQDSLIASFPGFIQSIKDTLDEAQDYHIMVVDTDEQWGGECAILCGAFFNVCPDIPEYPCMTGPPSPCDHTLGAGVNHTMGSDAPNIPCNFSTGMRYMDSTEPDLTSAFQCAAKVGSDGDGSERPMSSMVAALGDQLAAQGACNEGFIREDAILVVTVITDEEDSDSTGIPDGWFANVVASKAGDATAIVMLGLINDNDAAQPICPVESEDPVKIRTFIDMFPNSIRGSVCEANYNSFFQQAVDLIDTTCDEFEPPAG